MGIQNIKIKLLIFWIMISYPLFSNGNDEFNTIDEKVNSLYNFTVETITPDELIEILPSVYLIDTRSKKEVDISQIKGANFINYSTFDISLMDNISKNTTIVLYCTIGYRSEEIGEKLLKKGYSKVYNLYGGILNWVNNGYEIYKDDNISYNLHTYSKNWSKYLSNSDLKAVY